MNLLQTLSQDPTDLGSFFWENQPQRWESLPGGGLRIYAPEKSDYFQDPAGKMKNDSAPYLYINFTGDFVARAHVRPTFTTTYDAGALMVRQDATTWAKLCFESTDFGTTAAVSVVTKGVSDDANGVDLTVPSVWLQVVRVGNVFGQQYSLDGQSWRMVRLFQLPVGPTVKVGMVAQSPIGPGTSIDFLSFTLEQRTVQNLRAGI